MQDQVVEMIWEKNFWSICISLTYRNETVGWYGLCIIARFVPSHFEKVFYAETYRFETGIVFAAYHFEIVS